MSKVSRQHALKNGYLFYFTGVPCSNGHVSKRYARGSMCYACLKMHRDKSAGKNRERAAAHAKENPELGKKRCLRWRSKNRYKVNSIEAKRRSAKRRSAKRRATPEWLTKDHLIEIDFLYWIAAKVSDYEGVKYHVDHIVPLQGESVSGLHVPWNLRVIPGAENISKSNKVETGLAA